MQVSKSTIKLKGTVIMDLNRTDMEVSSQAYITPKFLYTIYKKLREKIKKMHKIHVNICRSYQERDAFTSIYQ